MALTTASLIHNKPVLLTKLTVHKAPVASKPKGGRRT